jgi:hypothetical protein
MAGAGLPAGAGVTAALRTITLQSETGREVLATLTSDDPPGLILSFGMFSIRLPAAEADRLWRWLQSWEEGVPFDPGRGGR